MYYVLCVMGYDLCGMVDVLWDADYGLCVKNDGVCVMICWVLVMNYDA